VKETFEESWELIHRQSFLQNNKTDDWVLVRKVLIRRRTKLAILVKLVTDPNRRQSLNFSQMK